MQKRVLPSAEISVASKSFEKFFAAQEVEDIIEHYKDFCAVLQITPGPLSQFYPVLKVMPLNFANKMTCCVISKNLLYPL